jgi:hypothetical protein
MAMTQAIPPPPRGHVWSAPLQCWVVPITGRLGRRPSPDHILCTEPRCWVLVEGGAATGAALAAAVSLTLHTRHLDVYPRHQP